MSELTGYEVLSEAFVAEGVPAETVARLADASLPFTTDVAFGGAGSIAATPRLGGTISIRRERGDVRYDAGPGTSREEASIGLSRLDLDVRWQHDGLSVGNVRVVPVQVRVAAGHSLAVRATLADDPVLYPTAQPTCAALKLRIDYLFTLSDGGAQAAT